MGNQNFRQAGQMTASQDPKQFLQMDIPRFIALELISRGKFMKTFSGRIEGNNVIIKIYFRSCDDDLVEVNRKLSRIWLTLSPTKYPNLLPYQMWFKSTNKIARSNTSPTYLIRQYLHSSLNDRLSTRPFLNDIEKRFIIYQLMRCLEICHEQNTCHGDVSPENVMVTSWNWLILTDFSPYKPTKIPVDDPSDFTYFYDSMSRRRCYLAPERFYERSGAIGRHTSTSSDGLQESSWDTTEGTDKSSILSAESKDDIQDPVLPSMDVYALGCTIAEIFLGGEPLLDLSATLQYIIAPPHVANLAQEDSTVRSNIHRIKDEDIKRLVAHMTQRDPKHRRSVREYREDFESSGSFPVYFSGYLYDLYLRIHWEGTTPDDRIRIIAEQFGDILLNLADTIADSSDYALTSFFQTVLEDVSVEWLKKQSLFSSNGPTGLGAPVAEKPKSAKSSTAKKSETKLLEELTEECKRLIDFIEGRTPGDDPAADTFSGDGSKDPNVKELIAQVEGIMRSKERKVYDPLSQGPTSGGIFDISTAAKRLSEDGKGLLLPIQIICSNIRHLSFPHSKITAILLLVRFGRCCEDDIILQRILPFIVTMLNDHVAAVRASAIRGIKSLLAIVCTFSTLESNLFQYYLFPAFNKIAKDPDVVVRIAFAESIGSLAETSKRFLDKSHVQLMKKTLSDELSKDSIVEASYDSKTRYLHEQVSRWIRDLVLETSVVDNRRGSGLSSFGSIVKRVLLIDIVRLCVFFGQESTMDLLLTQLLTFLNDQDWELRYAFCARIAAVCVFVGPTVTSNCMLPCIETALYDVEEMVVCRAVSCLATLVELSLLPHSYAVGIFKSAAALLMHPSRVIRQAMIQFTVVTANFIGDVDAYVFLVPLILPSLKYSLIGTKINEDTLKAALRPPVPRILYRRSLHSLLNASSGSGGSSVTRREASGSVDLLDSEDSLTEWTRERSSIANDDDEIFDGIGKRRSDSGAYIRDEAEEHLEFMLPYIDAAAREITTKTMQWKNGLTTGSSTAAGVAATLKRNLSIAPRSTSTNALPTASLEGLLEILPGALPDAQSLFVPSQKYGAFRPASEEKKLATLKLDSCDHQRLRDIFSVTNSLAEANRATVAGEFSFENLMDGKIAVTSESIITTQRLKALGVPPLSPDFGSLYQPDGRPFNMYTEALDVGGAYESARSQWRPKENMLVVTLHEHTSEVSRLAVSRDQSFFASASLDKTIKIWQPNTFDKQAYPKSALTYDQRSPVTDLCVIENTHSIASSSENGSIHIWRVEVGMQKKSISSGGGSLVSATSASAEVDVTASSGGQLTVLGSSQLKKIDPAEGSVLSIQHFNSDSASVLLYTTQKGLVHAWDLRSSSEPFVFPIRPELGIPTTVSLAPDRNWIVTGTSRGYIALWDIRFNVMSKLWRHSSNGPIRRLACCKSIPKARGDIMQYTDGAYLFVAAGNNEAAVWGVPEGGECYKCFRSVSMSQAYEHFDPLPILHDVPLPPHPNGVIYSALSSVTRYKTSVESGHSIRAIMGRISHTGLSYLVTAGTDKNIRFWDFMAPNRCLTVSGLEPSQPKGCFQTPSDEGLSGKLFICLDSAVPSPNTMLKAQMPLREGRGPMPVVPNYKDAILDLKSIDLPTRMILSCGRSGDIKLWR